ncbi:MAG: hypothetical protein GEV10_07175 [Streptosporangiales bacterium]|nr:hypothetical protein [Streptosporangiales bacterium]
MRERPGADAAVETVALGRASRTWRAVVLLVVSALFVAGSLVGDDHWWPFGPWRMFATATKPTGAVSVMSIEVRTTVSRQWTVAAINPSDVGLNRAEIEGQVPEIVADPDRLGTLAQSHERLRPDAPEWTDVRLVRRSSVIVDGAPTGQLRTTVLAVWNGESP